MSVCRRLAALMVSTAVAARPAAAQHAHQPMPPDTTATVLTFVARAREATRRYQDRSIAVADGYRRLGPEFPGMGEHWINLGPLVSAGFDAASPAVLTYATVAGRPQLVGVAYALPLLAGESPPAFPSSAAWHDHTGTIDDEVAALVHGTDDRGAGGRIAMLHAWIWLANADGIFATNNWALPYVRAGLVPPVRPDSLAAKALSLLTGGERHYVQVFVRASRAGAADSIAIETAIAGARDAVRQMCDESKAPPSPERLRAVWEEMEGALTRSINPEARARLAARRLPPQ